MYCWPRNVAGRVVGKAPTQRGQGGRQRTVVLKVMMSRKRRVEQSGGCWFT